MGSAIEDFHNFEVVNWAGLQMCIKRLEKRRKLSKVMFSPIFLFSTPDVVLDIYKNNIKHNRNKIRIIS